MTNYEPWLQWFVYWERGRPRPHGNAGAQFRRTVRTGIHVVLSRFAFIAGEGARVPS
jgi:hypothetical protein